MTNKDLRKEASKQLKGYRTKFAKLTFVLMIIVIIAKYITYNLDFGSILIYLLFSFLIVFSKKLVLNFCINKEFSLSSGFINFKVYLRYLIIMIFYSIISVTISAFIIIIVSATGVISFFDLIYNVQNKETAFILVIIFLIILLISTSLTRIVLQLFFFPIPYLIISGYGLEESVYMSLEIMENYKFKLFKLEISFIGWIILCILSVGVALPYVLPYFAVTKIKFYLMLLEEKNIIIKYSY